MKYEKMSDWGNEDDERSKGIQSGLEQIRNTEVAGKSSTRKSSKDLEMAAQNTPKITNWLRQVERPGNAQYLGRRIPYGASKMLEWEGMGRLAIEYHGEKEVMDRIEFKPERTVTLVEGSPVSALVRLQGYVYTDK